MIYNFLFHRVNPKRDKMWDPMDVALFSKCVNYITRNFDVVLFEDYMFNNTIKSNKIASIMFDDGYEDNFFYAAPILKSYNCKASFYVVTNSIDKNIPIWTYLIDKLFEKTTKSAINMNFSFLSPKLRVDKLETGEERVRYVRKLKPFLKTISNNQREIIVNRIIETYTDVKITGEMMNWDQLRQLQSDGHYIGSHTLSHPVLGMIQDNTTTREELFLSGEKIKNELGYFPLSISYPVGSCNDTVKKIAEDAGYKIGLAVNQKTYDPDKDDFFEVPRMELYNESWLKTKLRISNKIEKIRRFIS